MKKRSVWVAVLCLAASSVAVAAPIALFDRSSGALSGGSTIGFDAESEGDFVSRSFAAGAVTLQTSIEQLSVESTYSGLYGTSGPYISNHLQGASPGDNSFDIVFTDAVSAFGFNWGAPQWMWRMELYDPSDTLVADLYVPQYTAVLPPYWRFVGIDGQGDTFKRVRMILDGATDYVLLDDLVFVNAPAAALPEPASAVLVLGALAAVWANRRARRAGGRREG
jgi:hypothetical protein